MSGAATLFRRERRGLPGQEERNRAQGIQLVNLIVSNRGGIGWRRDWRVFSFVFNRIVCQALAEEMDPCAELFARGERRVKG